MDGSKQPRGIFKGRYIDSSPQRNRLRFQSVDEALEYDDSEEPDVRYVDSVKVARAIERERTLTRKLGGTSGGQED